MGVISRMFNKQAQLSLVREGEAFALVSFYDGKETAINAVIEKWPELSGLSRYIGNPRASRNPVAVAGFDKLRSCLHSLQKSCEANKKICIYIPNELERIQICEIPPEGFEITYQQKGTQLIRRLPEDVKELAEGWLCRDSLYWRYDRLTSAQQERLCRPVVQEGNLIPFLSRELPAFRQAGVRIRSELEYASSAAVSLEILSFGEERAEIKTTWHTPAAQIREDFCLNGYVEANHVIQPGIRPSVLREILPEETAILEGSRLACFLKQHYPALKKWFSHDLTAFEQVHQWVEPPYRWELVARAELNGVIGQAYAHPVACIGNDRFSPAELQEMLKMPYARISTGWVSKEKLLTLGMNEAGQTTRGLSLALIPLEAKQLLYRGGPELGSVWTAMTCEGAPWAEAGNKHACARQHLEYLLHWGVNGGLLGGYEALTAYGIPLLSDLSRRGKGCKILLTGRREDVRALKESYGIYLETLLSEQAYVCMDNDAVFHDAEARYRQWDLLILLAPDEYTHPAERERLLALRNMKARCKIGFFGKGLNKDAAAWDAQMLGYPEPMMKYLIQDCRAPEKLPPAYVFHPTPAGAAESVKPAGVSEGKVVFRKMKDGSAETVLSGRAGQGVSVPAREEKPEIDISFNWDFTDRSNAAFFKEARRLAAQEGSPVEHIPFSCYWPKYSEMDAAQRKWYFYLRSCIRRGEYPQTDLAYLYVCVYELLNLIGVKDAGEGLRLLMAVQQAYGTQYPQLQNHLSGWIYDFVHVYDCGVTAREIIGNMQHLSEAGLNELLTELSGQDDFDLPLWALERLSTYKITNSKFYQRGNQALIARCVPGALREINRQLRQTRGRNLLNAYAALKMHTDTLVAFNGAICEKRRTYTLRCKHYQNSVKLSNFLKNVIRYTENTLRTQMKYAAKLQGIELDSQTRMWIDAYIADQAKDFLPKKEKQAASAPSGRKRAKIALDLDKLAQLRADSDDVRDALLASVEESPEIVETIARPPQAQEGTLTDLDAVQAILNQMTAESRAALDHLSAHGWQEAASALRAAFPHAFLEAVTDEINAAAMARIGCCLIEREGDVYIIAEDYRDELQYLMPRQQEEAAWEIALEEADEEWKAFFAQTDPELLGSLMEGMEAFRACVKKRGEMPEPCLEEINNAAMDTIGDLLVTQDGIAEEYLPTVRQYLKKG